MRKYLPTLADLIDRMTICQLKSIFIPDQSQAYKDEIELIKHDIDLILSERQLNAKAIHAITVIMLTNRYIWENESKARQGGAEQDKLLKLTHSINGVRNTAKNVLSHESDERVDLKIDCFSADLIEEFGHWNIF